MAKIKKVLCVSGSDRCRGPMMKVLLKQKMDEAGHNVVVESAGILEEAKDHPAFALAEKFMGETELSLRDHRSRCLGDLHDHELNQFDIIICMEPEIVTLLVFRDIGPEIRVIVPNEDEGGITGPGMLNIGRYRACAAKIGKFVEGFVGALED